MSPADEGLGEAAENDPAPPAEPGPTRRVRCEHCFEVLWTRHPWDSVTCRCGELSLTGLPWSPTVRWASAPGGGWVELDPSTSEEPDEPTEHHPPIRIGYLR